MVAGGRKGGRVRGAAHRSPAPHADDAATPALQRTALGERPARRAGPSATASARSQPPPPHHPSRASLKPGSPAGPLSSPCAQRARMTGPPPHQWLVPPARPAPAPPGNKKMVERTAPGRTANVQCGIERCAAQRERRGGGGAWQEGWKGLRSHARFARTARRCCGDARTAAHCPWRAHCEES